MGGGKSLFLLIVSLFFVSAYFSSCAKEEVAPETSTEAVAAKKKGEGSLEKDVDPNAGCQCYMSVTGTANMGDWFWGLEDVTDPYSANLSLVGNVSGWTEQGVPGGYQPYPSPYFPLAPPDAGCHQFLYGLFLGSGIMPSDATVFTIVKCYDAQGALQTTVSYPFVFSDGIYATPPLTDLVYIWRLMSCEALTYDESYDCGRQGSGGDF